MPKAAPSLATLLATAARSADVLPHLHEYAVAVVGGRSSLLFEVNPRNGAMQATSGFGLDTLRTDPWQPGDVERGLVEDTFGQRAATLVTDTERLTPDLCLRLGTPAALLIPLATETERAGLLAVGLETAPTGPLAATAPLADLFLVSLEWFRFRRRQDLQRDLRDLLDGFTERLSVTLSLGHDLDALCQGARRLFGADRASVWIHDRRARRLVMHASSDATHADAGLDVPADDPLAPAAIVMRRQRAELAPSENDADASTVLVPLRGTRRALGAIVLDGVRVDPGGELDLLDRAEELGRQLSSAIESLQLLSDVVRGRRELEHVFDAIPYLVVVLDEHLRVVHANHAFASRLDRARETLIDCPLAHCVGPELAAFVASLAAAPSGNGSASCEVADSRLNGPFIVTVTERQGPGARLGFILVARELTPQHRLDVEREQLRGQIAQSEKYVALGQFVAGVAHELNNPLQGVLGHLELLRVTGAVPAALERQLQTVEREAARAARIVHHLLVFAGSGRVARRAVSLNAVIRNIVAERRDACRAAGIEVVRHYGLTLPRLHGDAVLLHQVFLNVFLNAEQAIAASGGPGTIDVRTTAGPDGYVTATIRDTGPGIQPDALPRLFEPFFTTKDVGQGTGLGLAIVYGIVQEHGGRISAANATGGGAVFTVELPVGRAHTR
jgi:signal transduction histidine kinase